MDLMFCPPAARGLLGALAALAGLACGAAQAQPGTASPSTLPTASATDVAQGAALSLEAALALASDRSQALPAQRALARAAQQRAVAAAQLPDPVLRVGLDNVPVEGNSDSLLTREPTTARSIGLVQALPAAAKRAARALRFERDADLALAGRATRLAALRRDAALAWLAVRAAQQRINLVDAQRVQAGRVQEAALAAYRAGSGAQADVFAARTDLARLDERRLREQAALADAQQQLQRWVGDAATRPTAALPAITDLPPGLLARAAADDPVLLQAAALEAAAQARVGVADEERHSDWSVDLRFAQRGPRFDNMVSIGVSLPLRWDPANRQDRELRARQAELQQAEAETEELRRERQAEQARWQLRWKAGLARLAAYDTALLPLAASRTQAALAAYRAGGGTLKAVLDAQQAELATQFDRVAVELDSASDWARLTTLLAPADLAPANLAPTAQAPTTLAPTAQAPTESTP